MMLTEVKKTVHIVVDDMNAVPNETMIQNALNRETKVMHTDPRQMCFDEHGDAMQAGIGLVPRMSDTEKVCPPIDTHNVSYHIWTVEMHFVRNCAFEPKLGGAEIDDDLLDGIGADLAASLTGLIEERQRAVVSAALAQRLRKRIQNKVLALLPQPVGN